MSFRKELGQVLRSIAWKLEFDRQELPIGVTVGRHTLFCDSRNFPYHHNGFKVTIGKFCSIASSVKILNAGEHRTDLVSTYHLKTLWSGHLNPDDPSSKGDVVIGNDVWLGMNVVVLSGVRIGDGAVVGAGSVVGRNIPPYAIVYGNPAKIDRFRFSPKQIEKLLKIAWWDWDDETIKARESDFYGDVDAFIAKYEVRELREC